MTQGNGVKDLCQHDGKQELEMPYQKNKRASSSSVSRGTELTPGEPAVIAAHQDPHISEARFRTLPLCLCDQQDTADGCTPLPRVGGKVHSIFFSLSLCLPIWSLIPGEAIP